jgi:hypothetical protein
MTNGYNDFGTALDRSLTCRREMDAPGGCIPVGGNLDEGQV